MRTLSSSSRHAHLPLVLQKCKVAQDAAQSRLYADAPSRRTAAFNRLESPRHVPAAASQMGSNGPSQCEHAPAAPSYWPSVPQPVASPRHRDYLVCVRRPLLKTPCNASGDSDPLDPEPATHDGLPGRRVPQESPRGNTPSLRSGHAYPNC